MTQFGTVWPYALAGVLLLALIILLLLIVLLRRSAKVSQFADADEPPADADDELTPEASAGDDANVVGIPEAFRRAARLIDNTFEGPRTDTPLLLLAGAERSRDADMLGTAGLSLPWGLPGEAGTAIGGGRGFWILGGGVVLDVAGDPILRADGKTGDDKAWGTIVSELRDLRPRRPIDGVIVTLACSELLDAAGNDVARGELAKRCNRIARRLSEAQRQLGFRLPVYVIVTGCERLPGFRSLCASLPQASRDEMLGWSTPHSIESVYRSAWIDDAFAALSRRLGDVEMEILANGTSEAEWLVRFQPAVASLLTPVRTCLHNLFNATAYQGSLMFRGIYLAGREGVGAGSDAQPSGRTAFLKDLIERKAFIERSLAAPTSRTVVARNRKVRVAQAITLACAILFGGGLTFAQFTLAHRNDELSHFFTTAAKHLRVKRSKNDSEITADEMQRGASEVLQEMTRIDFNRYWSVFIPSSWFSDFPAHVRRAISQSFHEIILKAIRLTLEKRLDGVISNATIRVVPETQIAPQAMFNTAPGGMITLPGDVLPAAVRAPVTPIEQMDEFRTLKQYVADVRQIEDNARAFNNLKHESDALHDLGTLVAFAFGRRLAPEFYENTGLYGRALTEADYRQFDYEQFKKPASKALENLTVSFYGRLYDRNPFLVRLGRLSQVLQASAGMSAANVDGTAYASLAKQLGQLEIDLSGPELQWAFRHDFELGNEFNDTLGQVRESAFLGQEPARHVTEAGRIILSRFREAAISAKSPYTGTILSVHEGQPEMRLSNDTLLLKSALDTFLGQPIFSTPIAAGTLRSAPRGRRLAWDPSMLNEALAAGQAYDRFRQKTLPLFAGDLRVAVDQVAQQKTRDRMLDVLSSAERFEAVPQAEGAMLEEELRSEIAAFNGDVPTVTAVVDAFQRVGAEPQARELTAAMSTEAYRLLQITERLLENDASYRPRQNGFKWWDGTSAPSPAAWGVRDVNEVGVYLDATRNRVNVLATAYAKPLLSWFTRAGERAEMRGLVDRWQGIVDDLRDYDAKKPGNSIALLEDYISMRMPKVSAADCSSAGMPRGVRARSSFFGEAMQGLSRDLSQQCYAVAGSSAMEKYAELERYFNQRLAGRWPFAANPPKPGEPEADAADLRTFFKLFDAEKAVITATPEQGGLEPTNGAERKFINDMVGVRKFFASFLDAPKPELAPSFDVEATFRILRQHEVNGDQVIDWTFGVGDDLVTNHDTKTTLRWTAGKPLALAIRWAIDGPRVPAVAKPLRGAVIDGKRTVMWDYRNRWSLLTALHDHSVAAETLPSYADIEPVTLSLNVFTKGDKGGQLSDVPTRVFLRLALLAPGTKEPLDVPYFPPQAPRAEKTQTAQEAE